MRQIGHIPSLGSPGRVRRTLNDLPILRASGRWMTKGTLKSFASGLLMKRLGKISGLIPQRSYSHRFEYSIIIHSLKSYFLDLQKTGSKEVWRSCYSLIVCPQTNYHVISYSPRSLCTIAVTISLPQKKSTLKVGSAVDSVTYTF
jgi:hypothetical protein